MRQIDFANKILCTILQLYGMAAVQCPDLSVQQITVCSEVEVHIAVAIQALMLF